MVIATRAEQDYIVRQVAEWIAAGDMLPEHADICSDALLKGWLLVKGKPMKLAAWCEVYHTHLKAQEDMSEEEFAEKKRLLNEAREEVKHWSQEKRDQFVRDAITKLRER